MKAPLKIAFFGSSLVSAYWNGAATYYRGIIRALHQNGHRVTFFEPDAYDRQKNRDLSDPEWAAVVVYPNSETGVEKALKQARNADLLIKASGVGVFDEWLERSVLEFQNAHRQVVFWDVDAPATLDRVQRTPDDPFRDLIPRYDLILTYGGGEPVEKAYLALGARRCVPIYNALDPTVHFRVTRDARFAADFAFLGNRLPDREKRVNEFFFQAAALLPEKAMLLGGAGWEDAAKPENIQYLGHVPTCDHNALNSSVRAVLNVNRESMARYGFSPPTRIFEAAGAGACLITDAWQGMELFLEPDKEVLVAHDGNEVAEHLKSLSPERAQQIGAAAFERVREQHTYARRAREFEAILED